jgi:glutamate-1-semialdehyde 2,1-aminomutase
MNPSNQLTKWQARARRVLAGGVSSHFRAADPVVFSRGRGSRVWDIEGNEYIDYTLSQGPLIHGHSHPEILRAVAESLADGQIWHGLHTREIELAEKLVEVVPCADAVRLGCTGSEAVQAAIRLARAYTGRPKIIKFEGHYHGWLDNVAASINPPLDQAGDSAAPNCVLWTSGMGPGSLDGVVVVPWNDLAAVEHPLDQNAGDVAAVITEPCMCNSGCIEPEPGYLDGLRRVCDEHGIVLIFDEVITGFRLALGGAQQHYDVTPDLAVFGKALAGGFPLSVLAGRSELMQLLADGRVIHAGTLNAHVGCVAAALASLRLLEADGGAAYRKLYELGGQLQAGLAKLAAETGQPIQITGPGPVFHVGFVRTDWVESRGGSHVRNYRDVVATYDAEKYGQFVQAMAARGVRLIGRGIWYLSTAHTREDVELTLDRARQCLMELSGESCQW